MSLCAHCGTVVEFAKEDFAKLQFQNGKKFLYHMECFTLNFVRFEDIKMKGVPNEAEDKVSRTAVGALDPQGNLFVGANEYGDKS